MFICDICHKVSKASEPCNIVPIEYRTREDGSKEIAKEAKVCERCRTKIGIKKDRPKIKKYVGKFEHKPKPAKRHKLKNKWKTKIGFSKSVLNLCKKRKHKA